LVAFFDNLRYVRSKPLRQSGPASAGTRKAGGIKRAKSAMWHRKSRKEKTAQKERESEEKERGVPGNPFL